MRWRLLLVKVLVLLAGSAPIALGVCAVFPPGPDRTTALLLLGFLWGFAVAAPGPPLRRR